MKCNTKTTVTIALALALVLDVGYWALPQFRGASAAFILVACMLVCPLSMLLMMRGAQSNTKEADSNSGPVSDRKQ